MEWVAIDFETANNGRNSPCALGIAIIKKGKLVKQDYWLIRPPDLFFDPYNVMIHGITEKDVVDKPQFDELWQEIKPIFAGNTLIAHQASFDLSVLRHTLDEYDIPYPELTYFCTRIFSKKLWPELISHSLGIVAQHLNINFQHHQAEEDARACAVISLRCCDHADVNTLEDLATKLETPAGQLFEGGYKPARIRKKANFKLSEISPDSDQFDSDNPFYDKRVAFTGTLRSMTRREAMQKVANQGGHPAKDVSRFTNFLIVGDQDFSKLKAGKKSSKMRKAEAVLSEGADIEILPEDEFLRMLN